MKKQNHDKAGKCVIITGGNNGIGFFMTKALLEDGFKVAVFDITGDNIEKLAALYPTHLLYRKCDVTKSDDIQSAVASMLAKWGQINVLVNNACLGIYGPFETKPLVETYREFEVNYFGYVRMIQAVLPHMKKQGTGIIHNVSSGVGITGFTNISGYASTKGAIEALTRTLWLELEKYHITVNLIHPPLTNTKSAQIIGIPGEMMMDPGDVGYKLAKKITSTQKMITPDFLTAFVTFLTYRFPYQLGSFAGKMTDKVIASRSSINF